MTLRSQLYLLQLEDYDLKRYQQWLHNNPGREVVEKKGQLRWSPKARLLYIIGRITGSIQIAAKITAPFDYLFKKLLVSLAFLKLKLFHSKLVTVGITGSWGKTTTKEILSEILKSQYKVYKTPANRNTLLGVAETVLRMPLTTQIFICEMGAYHKGDIKAICNLVHPKVGVITVIGPVHLERFGSLEDIRATKEEIYQKIPADGLKVFPGENAIEKVSSFFQIDPKVVEETFKNLPPIAHRLEVIENNGIKIIDDSYNSNPAGFTKALQFLRETTGKPKILVTPGMVELGKLQQEENEKVAILAKDICDEIIFVGNTNREAFSKGLGNFKNAHFVVDMDEAKTVIAKISKRGAAILFENDLPDQYI